MFGKMFLAFCVFWIGITILGTLAALLLAPFPQGFQNAAGNLIVLASWPVLIVYLILVWRSEMVFPPFFRRLPVIRDISNFGMKAIEEEEAKLESEEEPLDPHFDDWHQKGLNPIGIALTPEFEEIGTHVYLDDETRNRHCYVLGKTRTGKTGMVAGMAIDDIIMKRGLVFIDPHGDAAEGLLAVAWACRPPEDVIYFDATSAAAPAFNPLSLAYAPHKLTEDLISTFAGLIGDDFSARMEHLLRHALMTLIIADGDYTVSDLRGLFTNEEKRAEILAKLENEQLLEFWTDEYPTLPDSAAQPILTRLSAVLAPMSDMQRIFSHPMNDLDFTDIMDNQKVLIVNLAKGVLGDEASRLLGGMIVSGIQQAALARAAMPEEDRTPFYFFCDEFQNFTVASFNSILSESAKYKLNLTLANQNLGQLPANLRRDIFGNVGTVCCFQVSAEDAPQIIKEMHTTQVLARKKNSTAEYVPFPLFLQSMNASIQRAAGSRKEGPYTVGFAAAEFGHLFEARGRNPMTYWQRKELLEEIFEIINDPGCTEAQLRDIFHDWSFTTASYPAADDLINLPPRHAYIRIGSARNVTLIRSVDLPPTYLDKQRRESEVREHSEWIAAASRNLEESGTANVPTPATKPNKTQEQVAERLGKTEGWLG